MFRRILFLICYCVTGIFSAVAQDSLRVSFLTCGPGEESYALYGHTAIRVQNLRQGTDLVYNYGMFDFDAPHFVWRFSLGQTDYYLGAQPFDEFAYVYAVRGRYVDEQELALTPAEKAKIDSALRRTALYEDWTYRYNFLKDNCTTRALDNIEEALGQELRLPAVTGKTYREIVREFAEKSPWNRFGNDLALGAEADRPITAREACFSPIYAERVLAGVKVRRGQEEVSLAGAPKRWVEATAPTTPPLGFTPMVFALCLFTVTLGLTVYDVRRKKSSRWFDALLLLTQGIAGSIIAFLFFFSEHPTVGSNWNILWLNPLPLIALVLLFMKRRHHAFALFSALFIVLTTIFFIITALGVQIISGEIVLLASCLLLRSIAYLYIGKQRMALARKA